ncbi:MAG: DnaA/Hda family protein [Gemmatimonadaceae bacterium]
MQTVETEQPDQLDARFRFENFVVGSANRLAVSAARAVAQSPGAAYNPLFIYAASGLGKTHVLVAAGHLARQLKPGLRVWYVTVDEFVDQLNDAVASGRTSALKERYAAADMILLDDIQFLAGRRETQNEIVRVFNALQGSGRQIVITSDRPPSEIADLDQRLITRFSGGLVVDIGTPDYETRVAILRKKCDERAVHFDSGVVEEVARIGFENVRELQGALNRLIAVQTLENTRVSAQSVRVLVTERGVTPFDFGEAQPAPSSLTPPRGLSFTPVGSPALTTAPATPPQGDNEFAAFLSDLSAAVAKHLEAWHLRIRESADEWSAQGYRTDMLERAIEAREAPDVDKLIAEYKSIVDRLSSLQDSAASLDPSQSDADVFKDPDRLDEAEQVVERLFHAAEPLRAPMRELGRTSFEVGLSNQLAVHAADAVIADPGKKYNPLFVHGPSGVGKTHLVNAIGNNLVDASGGKMTVAYVNAKEFVDEVIKALQEGTIERLRARYRAADALILDDVQFAAGTERAQEELFHVYNSLYSRGKQIIVASDLAPKALETLEDRLRSRFEGGLVVQIKEPDRILREKLFSKSLSAAGLATDHSLVEYLAEQPAASANEISKTVDRLAKATAVAGVQLTSLFAWQELQGAHAPPVVSKEATANATDPFFLDGEKLVWDWPDVSGRAIEELR